LISRVADHCFWFGRYLERAESTARLLESTRTMAFDAGIPVTQCWLPLIIVSGQLPDFRERLGEEKAGDGEFVQRHMAFSEDNFVSLVRSIDAARENARVVRETLSEEVWHEVNSLYHWFHDGRAEALFNSDREGFYAHVRRGVQLSLGLVRSTMLHDEPMSFLWLGVMLERIGQIARILDMHHHTMERERQQPGNLAWASAGIVEEALWLSLLRSCSGFDAYRKLNHGRVTVNTMIQFVVFEPRFPRALLYCVRASYRILKEVWPAGLPSHTADGMDAAGRLESLMDWMLGQQSKLATISIHDLLTHVVDETAISCQEIGEEIRKGGHPEPEIQTESSEQ
jgi:uncharacterized alpha-E superfamily protein